MSEDFLKNPLSLFDVKGKTAIVTGATGAFGAVAAKTLAAPAPMSSSPRTTPTD